MAAPFALLLALVLQCGLFATAVLAAPTATTATHHFAKRQLLQSAKIGLSVGLSAGLIIAAGGILWLWIASRRASRSGRKIGERAPKHGEPVELKPAESVNGTNGEFKVGGWAVFEGTRR
jgi:ABC-type Fe3+ transport system permease subunit